MKPEDAVRSTYDAYNARDLTGALANLSPDVDWDDGEGHMLHGKEAIAAHWEEQWRTADARVGIKHLKWARAQLCVNVQLDTRRPDGAREQQTLTNTIEFDGELVRAMRIE
jgi:hypothetical protein